MKTSLLFSMVLLATVSVLSQVPQGFSYQAAIRDNDGKPIANRSVRLRIALQDNLGKVLYSEIHQKTTSSQGIVTLTVGEGTDTGGEPGVFSDIPWNAGDILMRIELDPEGGSNFTSMGDPIKLQSVPYALYAQPSKEIASNPNALDDEPIFLVRNKEGKVVFAVYQGGVRVYVDDSGEAKGTRSGFAVGGLTNQAKQEVEYFRITPDSARIIINERSERGKGARGGFAIGGLTNHAKIATWHDLMYIAPDSARIWVNSASAKGTRGGFAVGGLTNKSDASNFILLTPDNYFIGHRSGSLTTTGRFNSFIGYESGLSNRTGESNVFMGYQAGYSHRVNGHNIFIGNGSGYSDTSGHYNLYMGYLAGHSNINGQFNVMMGNSAGSTVKSGFDNVLIGNMAGGSSNNIDRNIFIGNGSGMLSNSTDNVFLGNYTGQHQKGANNILIGQYAGFLDTLSHSNIYIGLHAGKSAMNSSYNLFIGMESGMKHQSGTSNIFLGNYSGYADSIGNQNIFIGERSGANNKTGNNNLFLGNYSGTNHQRGEFNTFVGTAAAFGHLQGDRNVIIGYNSGSNNLNGSSNVFIGNEAGANELGSNKLYISNTNADSTSSFIFGDFARKTLRINSTVGIGRCPTSNTLEVEGEVSKTVAGNWAANSDRRIKTDIKEIGNAFDIMLKLRPVKFRYTEQWRKTHPTIRDQFYYNFIAQDFQQVFPESVTGSGQYLDGDPQEILQLDSYNATIVAVKALQELIIENMELHQKIQKQQIDIEALQGELEAIKRLLGK